MPQRLDPIGIVRQAEHPELMECAAQLKTALATANERFKGVLEAYREVGKHLIRAKKYCKKHGLKWLPWLRKHGPGISETQANKYISIFENWKRVKNADSLAQAMEIIRPDGSERMKIASELQAKGATADEIGIALGKSEEERVFMNRYEAQAKQAREEAKQAQEQQAAQAQEAELEDEEPEAVPDPGAIRIRSGELRMLINKLDTFVERMERAGEGEAAETKELIAAVRREANKLIAALIRN
jgi:hypothetical protein